MSSATTSLMPPKDPLICILGPTGTGKSALSISIARVFNGEIINADAMQMYKGLPIITNKLPVTEREGIPHHLLDHIGLEEPTWTAQKYVKAADRLIQEIRSRGKLPVVVGGSTYYIHALLGMGGMLGPDGRPDIEQEDIREAMTKYPVLMESVEVMYEKLKEVDPEMAGRWHPRDVRKIQRSLEIWLRTGKRASEVYDQQKREQESGSASDNEERRPKLRHDALLLWCYMSEAALGRLSARVDSMVQNGLFEEALQMEKFLDDRAAGGNPVDKGRGIWTSIGYKELEPWIQATKAGSSKQSEREALRSQCVDAVRAATRRYAKSQHRYISIRLAESLNRVGELDRLYPLNCTDIYEWLWSVVKPGEDITRAFVSGSPPPANPDLSVLKSELLRSVISKSNSGRRARYCKACDKTLMTEVEWSRHLKSRTHEKTVQFKKRQERLANDPSYNPWLPP